MRNFILFLLFVISPVFGDAKTNYEVNDVSIRGDSTLMNMRIESSYFADGAFLVETTGARFEYVKGQLKLYQGLSKSNRRLLSTITFKNEPNFIKVEDNNDHIILWSKDLNIGIYGDSTCIIAPKVDIAMNCRGNFKPDYEGRYEGELLLIDDKGGMEIYPQRYEKGYDIKNIELGKSDWVADYELNVGERVMIAAFPGKEFDWEASFKSNIVINSAGFDKSKSPFQAGILPSNSLLTQWSGFFNIVILFYNSAYKNRQPGGPYDVANEAEYKRVVQIAHANGMKVATYSSLFYWYVDYGKTADSYMTEIQNLKSKYNIDGVYIDGLTFDQYKKIDNKIINWETVRRLRQLFGPQGIIVLHGTHLGSATSTTPNLESYCTMTLTGEGVKFKDANDPYVQYQVRKYGISNTVGSWITYSTPDVLTTRQITDALIKMNGRIWYSEYDFTQKKSTDFAYYLQQLETLRQAYLFQSKLEKK